MNITSSGSRLLAGLALGAVTLTGCGSSGSTASGGSADATASPTGNASSGSASSGPGGSSPSMSASSSTPGDGTGSSGGSSPGSDMGGPPRCLTGDLRVSVSAGEGAAGSTFYAVRLRNVSTHPCRTGGFGGVSLVRTPAGAPVGAPADRVKKGAAKPLTLAPGRRAEATLQQTNAENYPSARCRPAPVKGLRVYPPNETHSAFVRLATTACRSSRVHLLSLEPYHLAG